MRPAVGPRRAVTKLKCVVSLSGFDSRLRFRSHSVARHCARSRIARARLGAAAHLASRGDPISCASRGRPGRCCAAASRVVARGAGSARDEPATRPRRASRVERECRVATARGTHDEGTGARTFQTGGQAFSPSARTPEQRMEQALGTKVPRPVYNREKGVTIWTSSLATQGSG